MLQASTEIIIRFHDCDPMGHTNNAAYFTFMEQSRVALFARVFGRPADAPIRDRDFPFILAEISCRFLKPTYANETLIVSATIAELKNSSFTIGYELTNKKSGERTAEGKSVQVWFDYKAGKPIRIPDDIRRIMEG